MIIETAYAIETGASILSDNMEFGDFVLLAISIFVLSAGIFSILFILWGGLLLILSGGKDDKIKPAINTIRYAVIGIIVTVFTIFVFPILGRLLGLDVEKYAEPKKIFQKIEELGTQIFGNSSSYNGDNIQNPDALPSDFSDL
ncbi:MAG: hypothetical protein PHV23_03755 [Candidatus Gracilibacteria bacterium]|nr:hypothetical protein [Candidatus Gracilibacteria bacterium]